MNGPQHYKQAERLLDQAGEQVSMNTVELTGETKADILAAAHAHATLALVAATAEQVLRGPVSRAWSGVIA